MGYDPVQGPNTYGRGCMPGCTRQFSWWRSNFDAGSLGCYNPASMGGMSLHAEGRAMDIALNANDPAERARGDAIFDLVMAHPEKFGAQEMLFRGYLWSWQRRSEGKRGPGIQQADHMNHVHLGIDVNAAQNWDESWVAGLAPGAVEDDLPYTPAELVKFNEWAIKNGLEGKGVDGPAIKWLLKDAIIDALTSDEGQDAIRKAVKE